MEYIAAALDARGHGVAIADLRFSRSLDHHMRTFRPDLVGVAAMHALETDDVLKLARHVRRLSPQVPIVIGGHTAAAFPEPFLSPDVAAVVLDDGERAIPAVVDALERRVPLTTVPGLALSGSRTAACCARPASAARWSSTRSRCRRAVTSMAWRRRYACLAHQPTWLVETARGCPFRCSFCSIWQLHGRAVRERSIDSVCRDLASVGDHVFVADDLFWYNPPRSLELAMELRRRGVRKQWMLVQSRVDLVARHPELLEAWRPLAREFDIFFGLEAATNEGLHGLVKDATVDQAELGRGSGAERGIRCDRQLRDRPGLARAGLRAALGLHRTAWSCFRRDSRSSRLCLGRRISKTCARGFERGSGRTSTCTTCCGSRRSVLNGSSSCTARRGGAQC